MPQQIPQSPGNGTFVLTTTVDAVSRRNGTRHRINIQVPCPIARVEDPPVVGRFIDGAGQEILRYGVRGRSFADTEDRKGMAGLIYRTSDGRFHGLHCIQILGHPEAAPRGALHERGSAGTLGDPGLEEAFDLSAAQHRIVRLREKIAADYVQHGAEILTVTPFPRWHVQQYGSGIELKPSFGEDRPEHCYVGADRRDDAAELMRLFSNGRREPRWLGEVLARDPAYDTVDDVALLAQAVGRFFDNQLRPAVARLPAELVLALHDVINWRQIDPTAGSELALAVIQGGFILMNAFEAENALSGRVLPHMDPTWTQLRDRLVGIEGFDRHGRRPAPDFRGPGLP